MELQDWNQIADKYISDVGQKRIYEMLSPFVWEELGELTNRDVLDFGCGHGWLSGLLKERDANVIGIDGSSKLINMAKRSFPSIEFKVADFTKKLEIKQKFDLVISYMVFMDLPEITTALSELSKLMKLDSKLIITIPHPCFFYYSWKNDSEGKKRGKLVLNYLRQETWRLESFGGHNHYHRPLSFYINKLNEEGFVVENLFEPKWKPPSNTPLVESSVEIPVFLGLTARLA